MKNKIRIIVSAYAASVMAFSALAQDSTNPKRDQAQYDRQRTPHPRADNLNYAAKAADIIGLEVRNYQDERLGWVEDLALDVESGRIVQVIVSSGGFLGIGDRLTAVPPSAFFHHYGFERILHLDVTKEKLKSAPEFEMSKWAESFSTNQLSTVYHHYDQESSLTFIRQEGIVHDGKIDSEQLPANVPVCDLNGTLEKSHAEQQRQSQIPAARLSHLQKASKLTGTPVKNLQDVKLGDVDSILVNLSAGRIVAVIVSAVGFIGIGDELSAVPPTVFRFTADRVALQLDTSKEMLSKAPHFKAHQWPDIGQSTYTDGVYRAYGVEPYYITDATAGENPCGQLAPLIPVERLK